jgi:hypothetical protein
LLLEDQIIIICHPPQGAFGTNRIKTNLFGLPAGFTVSQENASSVDNFYEKLLVSTSNILEKFNAIGVEPDPPRTDKLRTAMKGFVKDLGALSQVREMTDNELIKARHASLDLNKLAFNLKKILGIGND